MNKLTYLLAALLLAGLNFGWTPVVAAQQTTTTAAATATPPGPIQLSVDVTDAARKVFHAHEVMPVQPGPLTLYYPKYIPGEHGPTGPIVNLAGLVFTVNGKQLDWERDADDMYTFHLNIPKGATQLDISLDFLSPVGGGDFTAGVSATPKLVDLNWNQVALYPAGFPTSDLVYVPSLKIPKGWQFGTALTVKSKDGNEIHFDKVTFNNLVDSPVISGQYFRQFNLAPKSEVHRWLDVVADYPKALDASDKQIDKMRNLVAQANALFQSHHYKNYHFLLTLSDKTAHFGLEHHQSSDDRLDADFFIDPQAFMLEADLMPHEYVHSWNGKFRRPAELWQPDFEKPEHTRMLWVYEGLTDYLGPVLTARSHLWSPKEFRENLAMLAANMDHRPGRTWRPLIDVTIAAQLLYGSPGYWANWRRGTDFYPEGTLIWLDVDTKIRALSHGKHSLDDFAQLFYGIDNGSYVTKTYTFNDLVNALNKVQPYNWRSFLRNLLDRRQYHAPLDGITRSGWKLTYTDQPNEMQKVRQSRRHYINQMYGIGLLLNDKGEIRDVLWNGPAFKAGIGPGMTIQAVNGVKFSPDVFERALKSGEKDKEPLHLLIDNQGYLKTFDVDYHGGLRYPHLVREKDKSDTLSEILKPLKTGQG
ncbi:MAG TPA: M61 family peptidase [Gammaproteobacteria bacterium]|nr:M61 family peptidase [Gammaproteobacteria bacterium]